MKARDVDGWVWRRRDVPPGSPWRLRRAHGTPETSRVACVDDRPGDVLGAYSAYPHRNIAALQDKNNHPAEAGRLFVAEAYIAESARWVPVEAWL